MSERCFDAMECRPEDLRCALSIHTQKITDSCRDKDCIEDLRVYLTRESQTVLDAAAAAKVRSAELIYTAVDVSPLAFHRNHYAIDLTFYYKVIADAAVGPCRPAAICGLALFSKRAVLCGENNGAHIFRSDRPGNTGTSLPTAVVEVMGTNSQEDKTTHFSQEKWVVFCIMVPHGAGALYSAHLGILLPDFRLILFHLLLDGGHRFLRGSCAGCSCVHEQPEGSGVLIGLGVALLGIETAEGDGVDKAHPQAGLRRRSDGRWPPQTGCVIFTTAMNTPKTADRFHPFFDKMLIGLNQQVKKTHNAASLSF